MRPVRHSSGDEREAEEVRPLVGNFSVGNGVWVRSQGTRCTERSQPGFVTAVPSPWVVEVAGTPRHVNDLRRRQLRCDEVRSSKAADIDDDEPPLFFAQDAAVTQPVVVSNVPASTASGASAMTTAGPVVSQGSLAVTTTTAVGLSPVTSGAPAEAAEPRRGLRLSARTPVEVKRFCCEFGNCEDIHHV